MFNWINKDISNEASKKQLKGADPNTNVWISASAGSGKTKVLINRLLRLLLCDGVNVNNILCITFTNAGASEMKNRLMKKLSDWAKIDNEILTNELNLLYGYNLSEDELNILLKKAKTLFYKIIDTTHGIKIQTIHSFAQSLLGRFPLESGVGIDYKLLEDKTLLCDEIFNIFINKDFDKYKQYINNINEYNLNALIENALKNININFLEEFKKTSFKEKISQINKKFNIGDVSSIQNIFIDNILKNNDFKESLEKRIKTSKAQPEVKESFEKMYNAICCNNIDEIFNMSFKFENLNTNIFNKNSYRKGYVRDEIDEYNLSIEKTNIKKQTLEQVAIFDMVIKNYELIKQQKSYLDYDDILEKTINLLKIENISQWVLYKTDYGHRHILLDESQDTSKQQWEIVKLLTNSFFDGSSENQNTIFCVGDEKQSIYGFQGGDPKLFNENRQMYEQKSNNIGKPFSYINLDISFRTTPIILEFVDKIFSNHGEIISSNEKITHTACKDKLPGYIEVNPVAPTHEIFCDEIVNSIKNTIGKKFLHSEGRYAKAGDIAILFRNNLSDDILVKKLLDIGVGVSFFVKNDFKKNIVFEDLLSFLKFIILPVDNLNLACLLKSPIFNFTDDMIEKIYLNNTGKTLWHALRISEHDNVVKFLNKYLNILDVMKPSQILQKLLYEKAFNSEYNVLQNFTYRLGSIVKENIENIISIIQKIEHEKIPTMQTVVNELVAYTGVQKIDVFNNRDEITICTAHNSKGKEFPIVYLVDNGSYKENKSIENLMNIDGTYVYSTKPNALKNIFAMDDGFDNVQLENILQSYEAEELRLLYVAITRAIEGLCCFSYYKKVGNYSWFEKIIHAMQNIDGVQCIEHKPVDNVEIWDEFKNKHNNNKKDIKKDEKTFLHDKYVYEKIGDIVLGQEKNEQQNVHVKLPNWVNTEPLQLNIAKVKNASSTDEKIIVENEYINKIKNKGIIIHKLFEYLNKNNFNNFELIKIFLKYNGIDNENEIKTIFENVNKIFKNNVFMSDGEIKKEVEIWYDSQDKNVIHAVVDHICILNDTIYIMDIKTTKYTENISDSHKNQILNYIDGVKKIYGNNYKYIGGVIYTDNAKVLFI